MTCEFCGQPFEAQRSTRKTCSDRCRFKLNARKRRIRAIEAAGLTVPPIPTPQAIPNPSPSPLVVVTERTLQRAGRLETPLGLMTLMIADRLSNSAFETCAGMVALSRELDRLLTEVRQGAEEPHNPLDGLERRRRQKAALARE
jgi:hypothetical protein